MLRTLCVILGMLLLATSVWAEETPVLKTLKDKVSYATGVEMARSFKQQGVEVDRDLFLKGVGIQFLWRNMAALLVFGVAILVLSALRFHKKLD